jgi:putative ABC transport system permease protein
VQLYAKGKYPYPNLAAMIRNFFTVAIRNFLRQKFYSFINLFGLASGLICALFIYLWVNDELSKDKFHKDSDRIFQVVSNLQFNEGETLTWDITPGPLGELISDNFPEVELAVRTMDNNNQLFQYKDNAFYESGYFADPGFFKLFSFKILQGVPNTDSANISSISISQKLSTKLFGSEDPIGKTVKINNSRDYAIAAVFEDVGTESSLAFDFILPMEVYKKNRGTGFNWGNFDHPLYLKIADASKVEDLRNKINEESAKAVKAAGNGGGGNYYLQPFTERYLNSQFENGQPVGGRIKYVQIFSIVAVFILAIACINFMNMATAKAATRSKEVGVRKVVGAQRKSLVLQFIAESTFISFLAMVIAVAVVYLMLPLFNSIVSKEISLQLFEPKFLVTVILIVLVTGLLAGSYPAFYLSSYQPAQVLKGGSAQATGTSLRKVLVVFQFALTVILIACSLVVYNQIEFIRNKNIGYDRESLINFSARGNLFKQFEAFKTEALQFPGIISVGKSNSTLVEVGNQNGSVEWQGKDPNSQVFFRTVVVDYDFIETMGLTVVEGRSFKKEFQDTASFIISRTAADVMGMNDPVGESLTQWGNKGTIVGVIEDFHSRSMHEAIDPIVLMCRPDWTGNIFVRFDGTKTKEAVQHLSGLYKKFNPEYPFAYSFVDDDFEKLYNNEKVTGSLALGFTIMAIIISGLGLLGLAAYTAERKRKEISIRKTLGATVAGIVSMMSRDFIVLSSIAAIIGCPVAYFLMEKFLEGYAYHTTPGWELFIITAGAVLLMSLITVIFQVTKAAVANPVDALRNE